MRHRITNGPRSPGARIAATAGGLLAGGASVFAAYLLSLAGAARRPPAAQAANDELHLTVLIPAHDEAPSIGAAVAGALACDYPTDRRRVIVIADNCTDETAGIARSAGAEVWERVEPEAPGKGQALAWALDRLAREEATDAVVFIDADCTPSRNLLEVLSSCLAAGADAAQARNTLSDPESSPASALRGGAFALMNVVRPRGKERLGLSCGLTGTGMAVKTETLSAVPWRSFSLVEDREYHLLLLDSGRRVRFADEAEVRSPASPSAAGANTQETRWDAGNVDLARRWIPPLIAQWRRDPRERLHAAFELAVPPQAALVAMWGAGLVLGSLGRSRSVRRLGLLAAVSQAAYVLVGLRVAEVPPAVWRALPRAPGLVARRVLQLAGIARRPPARWERTERVHPS